MIHSMIRICIGYIRWKSEVLGNWNSLAYLIRLDEFILERSMVWANLVILTRKTKIWSKMTQKMTKYVQFRAGQDKSNNIGCLLPMKMRFDRVHPGYTWKISYLMDHKMKTNSFLLIIWMISKRHIDSSFFLFEHF